MRSDCLSSRMEENAFDPVRAVASLSPSSLLCPSGALRVLGSGFIGIVFLEEDTSESSINASRRRIIDDNSYSNSLIVHRLSQSILFCGGRYATTSYDMLRPNPWRRLGRS